MRLGIRVNPARMGKARDFSKLTPKVILNKRGYEQTVYVKLGLQAKKPAEGRKVEEKERNPVQHDGEYVLTSDGNRDFGEISSEIAREIRRQAGKIRLRIGVQDGTPGDFGEKHIERTERLRELQSNGYQNARDFVQNVVSGYTAIYSGEGGRLTLYKNEGKKGISLFVELLPSVDGDFYDVKTGMVTRDTYYKNKKPLWKRTQSG